MPWMDVACPNEECPGREVSHPLDCPACNGTKRRRREDGPGYTDCDAEDEEMPQRWRAFWFNSTLSQPGEWDSSICCPACGEEGEEVD